MTHRDDMLRSSTDYKTIPMPLALYCAFSDCQTLIMPGTLVKKFDGATYVHETCPKNVPHKNFAAHKQPNSNLRIS